MSRRKTEPPTSIIPPSQSQSKSQPRYFLHSSTSTITWSEEEDDILRHAVARGMKWKTIKETYFSDSSRSQEAIRAHWKRVEKIIPKVYKGKLEWTEREDEVLVRDLDDVAVRLAGIFRGRSVEGVKRRMAELLNQGTSSLSNGVTQSSNNGDEVAENRSGREQSDYPMSTQHPSPPPSSILAPVSAPKAARALRSAQVPKIAQARKARRSSPVPVTTKSAPASRSVQALSLVQVPSSIRPNASPLRTASKKFLPESAPDGEDEISSSEEDGHSPSPVRAPSSGYLRSNAVRLGPKKSLPKPVSDGRNKISSRDGENQSRSPVRTLAPPVETSHKKLLPEVAMNGHLESSGDEYEEEEDNDDDDDGQSSDSGDESDDAHEPPRSVQPIALPADSATKKLLPNLTTNGHVESSGDDKDDEEEEEEDEYEDDDEGSSSNGEQSNDLHESPRPDQPLNPPLELARKKLSPEVVTNDHVESSDNGEDEDQDAESSSSSDESDNSPWPAKPISAPVNLAPQQVSPKPATHGHVESNSEDEDESQDEDEGSSSSDDESDESPQAVRPLVTQVDLPTKKLSPKPGTNGYAESTGDNEDEEASSSDDESDESAQPVRPLALPVDTATKKLSPKPATNGYTESHGDDEDDEVGEMSVGGNESDKSSRPVQPFAPPADIAQKNLLRKPETNGIDENSVNDKNEESDNVGNEDEESSNSEGDNSPSPVQAPSTAQAPTPVRAFSPLVKPIARIPTPEPPAYHPPFRPNKRPRPPPLRKDVSSDSSSSSDDDDDDSVEQNKKRHMTASVRNFTNSQPPLKRREEAADVHAKFKVLPGTKSFKRKRP